MPCDIIDLRVISNAERGTEIKMKRTKRIITFALAILMLLLSSCAQAPDDTGDGQGNASENKIIYEYRIAYKDIEFISKESREAWREPLTKLLSNKATPYGENGELLGYTYLYPDQPCIANGNRLGLFDFDMDGVPELLVDLGGGSAGNAFYYVYDIVTGEHLGSINGGFNKSWCIYFNSIEGKYENIGQFEWRSGWQGKQRMVMKATLTNAMSDGRKIMYESHWLYEYYEIEAVEIELTSEDIAAGVSSAWDEIYTGAEFGVNGDKAYIEDYFAEYDSFLENYVRIPESALMLVEWEDVCDDDEDQTVRAKKMAEALLSSSQEFIIIKK